METNAGLELYTQCVAEKPEGSDPVPFSIFWLVPSESYTVEIDLNEDEEADWSEMVTAEELSAGEMSFLNDGETIIAGQGVCNP